MIENRAGRGLQHRRQGGRAAAPPDGYTLLFTGNSYAINQTLYRNAGYATAGLAAGGVRRDRQHGARGQRRQSGA